MLEQLAERAARNRLDRHLEPFVARGERLDERADVLGDEARRDDLHPPRRAGRVVHRPPRLLGQPEDLARERGQAPPARRQRDPAPLAHEELVAELAAQRRDRHRHGRLGDLELRGRGLHRPVAGDQHERLQLGEGQLARSVLSIRLSPVDAPTLTARGWPHEEDDGAAGCRPGGESSKGSIAGTSAV
jgi:hypothetical protein